MIKSRKRLIWVIRSFNDVDNLLPYIDYLLSENKLNLDIFDISYKGVHECGNHLEYIDKKYSTSPRRLIKEMPFILKNIIFIFLWFRENIPHLKNKMSIILSLIVMRIYEKIIEYLPLRPLHKILNIDSNTIIICDVGSEVTVLGSYIVSLAERDRVPVIGLMHGYSIYTNRDSLYKSRVSLGFIKRVITRLTKPVKRKKYFDCYIVGIDQVKTIFSSRQIGIFDQDKLNRVKEVGVPRYTKEWVNIYRNEILHNKKFFYGCNSKLNVVFFMSHPQYNADSEMIISLIERLSKIESINFVFKPHTRNHLDGFNKTIMNGFDATTVNSVQLTEWADICIVFGSSISFQAIVDGVPVVVPSYIHSNTTILEENNVCIDVKSEESLIRMILEKYEFYNHVSNDKVYEFIDKYIYGGKTTHHSLMTYVDRSIESCMTNEN